MKRASVGFEIVAAIPVKPTSHIQPSLCGETQCSCRRRPANSPRFRWRPPDDYHPTGITTYSTRNEAHSRDQMRSFSGKGRGPCRYLRTNGRHTRAQVMCYPGGKDRRSAVGRDGEEWAATTTRRMPTVVALKDPAPSLYWGSLKTGSKPQLK
ncbi:hypothetical protein NPIL_632941 [Nephila pilipes]|uniref:Uncharacterized protein n=1 Tax=Nephila pilipes TaxID=299642 RepID=A0A8X6UC42_NEPPI|nr:hypothetical protein NPIL_632941 [Nephila pilipes]